MKNKVLYAIVTILVFTCCRHNSSDSKYLNISKDSTVVENTASTELPILDTTIIVRNIKKHVAFGRDITEKDAEVALYRYFTNKGVVERTELKRIRSSDEEKVCIDYDTLYRVHTSRFSGAIISYWLGECELNGHCFQPSKAIIMRTKSGYGISNENFIPTDFAIDSIVGPIVYGYDYDCGGRGIIRHFKVTLRE